MSADLSPEGAVRIGILEDHLVVREALVRAFAEAGFSVRFACGSADELLADLEAEPVAVLVFDLCVRGTDAASGLQLLERVREQRPATRVVVLTGADELELASASMIAGAYGFITKHRSSTEAIVDAVSAAARGERRLPLEAISHQGGLAASRPVSSQGQMAHLTLREREVLACVADGHDNLKIAAVLGITERTAKAHVSSLYRKLGVENRVQLALAARKAPMGAPKIDRPLR